MNGRTASENGARVTSILIFPHRSRTFFQPPAVPDYNREVLPGQEAHRQWPGHGRKSGFPLHSGTAEPVPI